MLTNDHVDIHKPVPNLAVQRLEKVKLRCNNYAEWSGVPKIQENLVSPNMFPLNHVNI